jgi:hypothetical protein
MGFFFKHQPSIMKTIPKVVENLKPAWFNPPGWFFICLHIIKWRRLVNLYRLWKLGALR